MLWQRHELVVFSILLSTNFTKRRPNLNSLRWRHDKSLPERQTQTLQYNRFVNGSVRLNRSIFLCDCHWRPTPYAKVPNANYYYYYYYVNRREIIKLRKKIHRIMWRTLSINGKKNYFTVCERDNCIANNIINLMSQVRSRTTR